MLIYPVPHKELEGLGVHATVDLRNASRFGPDTEHRTLTIRLMRQKDSFYKGAIKLSPDLIKDAFTPSMSGIRPSYRGGEKTRDFVIKEETGNGLPGLINLISIRSAGLTASPAIANGS